MPRPRKDGSPTKKPRKVRLTDRFVRNVEPGDALERYWDVQQGGLVLFVTPKGHKGWNLYFRFGNRVRWYTIGSAYRIGLADARAEAKRLSARMVLDPDFDPQAEKVARRKAGTFGELAERYLEEYAKPRLKSASQSEYKAQKYLLPRWKNLPASAIKRSDVKSMFRSITNSGSLVAANQALAQASAIFSWAIREEVVDLPANPAQGIMRNETRARERVLSEHEIPQIWDAFDSAGLVRSAALKTLLLTGQRLSEVTHMRVNHIDIRNHRFSAPDGNGGIQESEQYGGWWSLPGEQDERWPGTKNKQGHRVWISGFVLEILSDLGDGQNGYILAGARGNPVSDLDVRMKSICDDVGIVKPDKVTPHDLRRTHGTMVTSLGFSREQMNRIQNHREGGIASVYDRHSYAEEHMRIQEAVTERIRNLIANKI